MIQSTAATLRLAVLPGAAAPGAPVAVNGGGVFTLPGIDVAGDVTPGASMPNLPAMMVAGSADDRQPNAATGKGLPMPGVSPALPPAGDASPRESLPVALTSSMPQPAPDAADDEPISCGLIIDKPLGLKPVAPGDPRPVLMPTPKVPLPVKAPRSDTPPAPAPVNPASPPVAGAPAVAPVILTPPTAVPIDAPTAAPQPQADTPAILPDILTPPLMPPASGKPFVPPTILTPPVPAPRPTVAEEFPLPVEIIYVDVDMPVKQVADGPPVAAAAVVAAHTPPPSKPGTPPVDADSGGPTESPPSDPAPVGADIAAPIVSSAPVLPTLTPTPTPTPTDVSPATLPVTEVAPPLASASAPVGVSSHVGVKKDRAATAQLRPARTPVPTSDPVVAKPPAPEQISVALDASPTMTLPRSLPIVEHAPVDAAPVPVDAAKPSTVAAPAENAVNPATSEAHMLPVSPPIVALAAAVPIAGALVQQPAPKAPAGVAPAPPRDEVAEMAAAMNATITAPAPVTVATSHPDPVGARDGAPVLATPPAFSATPAPTPVASPPPTLPITTGAASPITPAAATPPLVTTPVTVAEVPVAARTIDKPAIETRADAVRPASAPDLSPAPVGTTAAAGIVFGAAKLAAQRSEREDRTLTLGSEALAATTAPAERLAVAATQGGNQPSLNMTDQRWPHAMVAHIEALRDAVADAANAADTRIRLVPDALGGIDIGVRQDGDTLHVHFAADQPQTRALLQEAQPRLAEAAEARGLKLGQTSVGTDAGHSQQRQQQQPHQSAAQPVRRNSFTATTSADETGDGRIA
ncbi:flagellar hook-length control protein FliK [Microvirga sp. SRT01]|uniref:Flagellar hook-length control protein FliK n=1 Tax=Sphingomonas longa TaxID=2778730 RepID=A0ABS2DB54_9SPHN|nr:MULTISPECIES: flagellar hook-length control protein FliK [Alphaproteobacteria]MBM6578128.1 flagellar hook-length control protein FliK [Sphingomonas sp. BT552]MBR7711169.1 flagellar hook-length control protein FliK [Microvirga sp. SRT01]